jgi:hypothetical protein
MSVDDYWRIDDSDNEWYCTCEPRYSHVKILVRVIRFSPDDCTYNVIIWEDKNSGASRDMFDYSDPICEFSVASTVDLERYYNMYLQKYYSNISGFEDLQDCKVMLMDLTTLFVTSTCEFVDVKIG